MSPCAVSRQSGRCGGGEDCLIFIEFALAGVVCIEETGVEVFEVVQHGVVEAVEGGESHHHYQESRQTTPNPHTSHQTTTLLTPHHLRPHQLHSRTHPTSPPATLPPHHPHHANSQNTTHLHQHQTHHPPPTLPHHARTPQTLPHQYPRCTRLPPTSTR